MCLRLFENACKIETFGLEEHDEVAYVDRSWCDLERTSCVFLKWPMTSVLYMRLNIHQIYIYIYIV